MNVKPEKELTERLIGVWYSGGDEQGGEATQRVEGGVEKKRSAEVRTPL